LGHHQTVCIIAIHVFVVAKFRASSNSPLVIEVWLSFLPFKPLLFRIGRTYLDMIFQEWLLHLTFALHPLLCALLQAA